MNLKKKYEESIFLYKQLLKIRCQNPEGNHNDIAVYFKDIGFIYSRLKEYDNANFYYLKALKIWQQLGNAYKFKEAVILIDLIELHTNQIKSFRELEYVGDIEIYFSQVLKNLISPLTYNRLSALQLWIKLLNFLVSLAGNP